MSRISGLLNHGLWITEKKPAPYAPSQVFQWLKHIGYLALFPALTSESTLSIVPINLKTLQLLNRLFLTSVPYENTELHYTATHYVDVSLQGLYDRIVVQHKGSWCFGLNTLFLGMIQSLGFRAYAGAARVNLNMKADTPPQYSSLGHMVIFVQPEEGSNITYLVDVGFGGSAPTRPILLSEESVVYGTTPTEQHRLTRGSRSDSSLRTEPNSPSASNIEWRLEVRHEKPNPTTSSLLLMPTSSWRILYTFSENEFFTIDIQDGSHVVSTKLVGMFHDSVVAVKYYRLGEEEVRKVLENLTPAPTPESVRQRISHLMIPDSDEVFLGRTTLEGREVKRNIGSRTEHSPRLENEETRVETLRRNFGIHLHPTDIVHIRGRKAAIQ